MDPIFIFDIDGVLTHPHIKKPNKTIISFITNQLQNKKLVALATGRAIFWIETNIIHLIQTSLQDQTNMDNLFICGEKGGVWIDFVDGKRNIYIDRTIHFPREVVKKVIFYLRNKEGIFFDQYKYTMVSVEINGGEDPEVVKKQKEALYTLETWVKNEILPAYPNLELDPSEISVDILVKGISKRLAAKKFLDFLEKKHISPKSFIMFGDS